MQLGRVFNLPNINPAVSAVTVALHRVEQGDPKAAEELLPLVYAELRQLAAARMAQQLPGQIIARSCGEEFLIRVIARFSWCLTGRHWRRGTTGYGSQFKSRAKLW